MAGIGTAVRAVGRKVRGKKSPQQTKHARKALRKARGEVESLDKVGGNTASSVAGFALVLLAFTVDIIQALFTITLFGTIIACAFGGLMFWVFPLLFKIAKIRPLGLVGGVLWMGIRVFEVLPFVNAFFWFTIAMVAIAMYSAMAQMRS